MKRFWMNTKYWMRRRVDALVIWFPLMTKKQHEHEMKEAIKKIDAILDRASRIEWRREQDGYAMLLRLEPRMFGAVMPDCTPGSGYCSSKELRYLAKAFAYRVEAEIATARFIQSANQLERDKYRNTR